MSSNNSSAFYLDFKKKQKNEFEIPQLHTGAFAATSSNASKILNNAKKIIAENKSTSKPVAISRLTEGLVSLDNSSKVKLPDVDFTQENSSSKKADSFIKKNDNFEITPVREGTRIKNNIKSSLEHKYGSMDTKNLFDDIPDDIVEKNISTAKSAIDMNIKRGRLNFDYEKQFPNIVDGLSVYYAADEVGNSKEAKKAREAAYMKFDEPLVKDTGMKLLSAEIPTFTNVANETRKKTEVSKVKADEPKESKREIPENIQGVRFKAMTRNETMQGVDSTQDVESPKTFYDDYMDKKQNNNNNNLLLPSYTKFVDYSKQATSRSEKFSYVTTDGERIKPSNSALNLMEEFFSSKYEVGKTIFELALDDSQLEILHKYLSNGVKNAPRPNNIGIGTWEKQVANDLKWVDDMFGSCSKFAKGLKALPAITIAIDTSHGIKENVKNKEGAQEIVSDAVIDIGFGAINATASAKLGGYVGTAISPGVGTVAGIFSGIAIGFLTEKLEFNGKSLKGWVDTVVDWAIDGVKNWLD